MSATPNAFGSISADAYRSPGTVTGSNPDNFSETDPADPPANTMVNNHQLTEVYDAHAAANVSQVQKSDFSHTDPAPVAPNFSRRGRDPYKQMPGEEYLDNVAGPASVAPEVVGGPAVLTDE